MPLKQFLNYMAKFYFLIIAFFILIGSAAGQSTYYYVNQTEVGALLGKTSDLEQRSTLSFQTFNGIKIHPKHELGILIGHDSYPLVNLVPLAIGWRGMLTEGKKVTPYASLDIGHASAVFNRRKVEGTFESWYQGGLYISPSIGIRHQSKDPSLAFSWSIGFKRQHLSYYEGNRNNPLAPSPPDSPLPPGFTRIRTDNYILNSLHLKWGIIFR